MRAFAALAFTGALSMAALPAHAQRGPDGLGAPDGTVTISAHAAALGVGYTWGDGTLRWHGRSYRFTVNGLSVLDVGIANVTGRGRVYNLHNLHDFDGAYGAVAGEATAGHGIGGEILRNGNGVQVRIDDVSRGARLAGSADGIKLTLK